MSDTPRAHFRAPPGLVSRLPAPSNAMASAFARRDLERYYTLLSESLPTFSPAEATLLAIVLSDTRLDTGSAHLLWAAYQGAIRRHPDLPATHGLGGHAAKLLGERLMTLTRAEALAIMDAAERAGFLVSPGCALAEALELVGLVAASPHEA